MLVYKGEIYSVIAPQSLRLIQQCWNNIFILCLLGILCTFLNANQPSDSKTIIVPSNSLSYIIDPSPVL